jgi:hypothetical protein
VRIPRRSGALAAVAVGLLTLSLVGNVAAAGATMRLVASSDTVAKDATFTVRVVQNSAAPTSGTQATVTFDQTKVQIQKVERGKAHQSSPVFLPSDMAGAITKANGSGKLKTIATAFLPPDSVPAGDQDFLIITFGATGCGKVDLGLPVGAVDAAMLDGTDAGYGNSLKVTSTGTSVTIDCSQTAPSGDAATSGNGATGAPDATVNKGSGENVAGQTSGPGGDAAGLGTNGPASGSGGLPLWLPLLLAIPALALIGYVLLKRPMPSGKEPATARMAMGSHATKLDQR